MITQQHLRGLENFLIQLCPPYNSSFQLLSTGDRTVKIDFQYEGYARIIADLLKLQRNIAKLEALGYEKILVVFTDIRKKEVTLIVETCDYLP